MWTPSLSPFVFVNVLVLHFNEDAHRIPDAINLMSKLVRVCLGLCPCASKGHGEASEGTQAVASPPRPQRDRIVHITPRRIGRASNQQLIRQSLVELPEAITIDSDMPALDELCDRAEESENACLQILNDIVFALPMGNPLSGALVATIVDAFPNQHMGMLPKAATMLTAIGEKLTTEAEARNLLIIMGVLAERHAGPGSERMFKTRGLLDLLLKLLTQTNERAPVVQLHALLAIEMFAMTGANKQMLLDRGVAEIIFDIETKFCSHQTSKVRSAESRRALDNELLRAQVGFCAMWMLDNVFPCEGRKYAVERVDVSRVNAMLDVKDATEHLKLAPHGLEARNDALPFESVRATCYAEGSGKWYYECMVFTSGIMQIGWANEECAYQTEDGIGIGDDEYSMGYDGCRRLLWLCERRCRHEHEKWKPGDVLGCFLDLNKKMLSFSLNGKWLKGKIRVANEATRFYPAASLMAFQHVQFNFGNMPYRYPPPEGVRSFNDAGSMTDEQKRIVPRLVLLEELRQELLDDDDKPRCQICHDNSPDIKIRPCGHAEFCEACIQKLDRCPLCRTVISGYEITSTENFVVEGASS